MTNILALIPARGGSKGVPGKNIKTMAGKPLIAWTISAAQDVRSLRTMVSTDDEDIARISRQYGASVPFMRPADLSTDTAGSVDVVLHALDWLHVNEGFSPEFILLLQPTSPLRTSADIQAAMELQKKKNANAVVSVCPAAHPVSWLIDMQGDGKVMTSPDANRESRRQDANLQYQLNGAMYLVRTSAFYEERKFITQNTFAYVMPPERSIDIDSPWDFYLADLILKDKYAELAKDK
jgi:CMP-N,N'-diacetyllegionaminic acid synthase